MSDCEVIVGAIPAPLTIRLMTGEPAGIAIPVEGTLTAPVIEWADGTGTVLDTTTLALTGVDDEGRDLWTVALTAQQVEDLADAEAARVVETIPERRVLMAGRVRWPHVWSGACDTLTTPLVVVGVPGPPGSGVDAAGAGAGQVPTADGAGDWVWADPGGGVTVGQLSLAIAEHAAAPSPHSAYDIDIPDLSILFENGLA